MAVQRRLITNVVVVGVATLILAVVSYLIVDNLVNFWIPEQENVEELVSQHLQMRRHEKDFLARDTSNPAFFETGQSAYIDSFLQRHDRLDELLEKIEANEAGEGDEEFLQVVHQAHENLDTYAETFLDAAEKHRERGMLGYGIVGELDSAGSRVQESLAGNDRPGLAFAEARIEEKNYLITRDPQFYQSVVEKTAPIRSEMQSAGMDAQLADLGAYNVAFVALVEIDRVIGFTENDGLTGSFRTAAHDFEENAEDLHEDLLEEIQAVSITYITIMIAIAVIIIAFNFGLGTILLRSVSIMVGRLVEHDRTETELRQKMEEANAALLRTEKAKDEFISMVSHELRTPIVPIKLYTDMLLKTKSLGEINEKQRKVLVSVQKGTDRLEMLIGDIFDVYKLDMGKLKFRMADTEIQSLVDQNIAELKSYTVEKKIRLETDLKASGTVWCDSKRVGQVFLNLVKNSVDFVPNGGEIIIRAEDGEDSHVVFTVQDNGPGITKGEEDGLFNKFYQADTSATRKHGGSGLGLAICRGIVERHGGKIWVDKTFTRGAAIKFTLSRRKNEQ